LRGDRIIAFDFWFFPFVLPIWSCVGNTHYLVFDLFQVVKIIADTAIIGDNFVLRLFGNHENYRRFEKYFGGCEVNFLFQKRSTSH